MRIIAAAACVALPFAASGAAEAAQAVARPSYAQVPVPALAPTALAADLAQPLSAPAAAPLAGLGDGVLAEAVLSAGIDAMPREEAAAAVALEEAAVFPVASPRQRARAEAARLTRGVADVRDSAGPLSAAAPEAAYGAGAAMDALLGGFRSSPRAGLETEPLAAELGGISDGAGAPDPGTQLARPAGKDIAESARAHDDGRDDPPSPPPTSRGFPMALLSPFLFGLGTLGALVGLGAALAGAGGAYPVAIALAGLAAMGLGALARRIRPLP